MQYNPGTVCLPVRHSEVMLSQKLMLIIHSVVIFPSMEKVIICNVKEKEEIVVT